MQQLRWTERKGLKVLDKTEIRCCCFNPALHHRRSARVNPGRKREEKCHKQGRKYDKWFVLLEKVWAENEIMNLDEMRWVMCSELPCLPQFPIRRKVCAFMILSKYQDHEKLLIVCIYMSAFSQLYIFSLKELDPLLQVGNLRGQTLLLEYAIISIKIK